jgi:CheY-like chemotaxis protein
MGLVGSLEDLGLGDILQIVSLSRKSGLLNLSWGEVRGKIFFNDGQVVAAVSTDITDSFAAVLVRDGLVPADRQASLDPRFNAIAEAREVKTAAIKDLSLRAELVEESIRKQIEKVVFHFFGWSEGTFSFELQEITAELAALKPPRHGFILDIGLSPQFLAMEGTRIQDERRRSRFEAPVGPPLHAAEPKPAEPADPGADETGIEEMAPPPEAAPAPARAAEHEADFGSVSDALAYYENQAAAAAPPPEPEAEPEAAAPAPPGSEPAPPGPAADAEPVPPPEPSVAPSAPAVSGSDHPQIIVVDDDPFLLESIGHHLMGKGWRQQGFTEVGPAVRRLRELVDEGLKPQAVLTDLIMSNSSGSGTLGGLEVLEQVRAANPAIAVYIMSDYENLPARARSEELGAHFFFMKPKSSQLDKDYSSPELINFIAVLEAALSSDASRPAPPAGAGAGGEEVNLGEELRREFGEDMTPTAGGESETISPSPGLHMLKTMISELNDPASSGQITLLVLRFAAEMMSRSVIFLVARNQLAGLGQFGITIDGQDAQRHVRRIRIPLNEPSIFREAIQKRLPLKKALKNNKWHQYLVENLGGKTPKEVFVAPIIAGGKIAAILYGDNVPDDRPIGDTESLEIFLAQAGLAMEKALLERRLREMGTSSDAG